MSPLKEKAIFTLAINDHIESELENMSLTLKGIRQLQFLRGVVKMLDENDIIDDHLIEALTKNLGHIDRVKLKECFKKAEGWA